MHNENEADHRLRDKLAGDNVQRDKIEIHNNVGSVHINTREADLEIQRRIKAAQNKLKYIKARLADPTTEDKLRLIIQGKHAIIRETAQAIADTVSSTVIQNGIAEWTNGKIDTLSHAEKQIRRGIDDWIAGEQCQHMLGDSFERWLSTVLADVNTLIREILLDYDIHTAPKIDRIRCKFDRADSYRSSFTFGSIAHPACAPLGILTFTGCLGAFVGFLSEARRIMLGSGTLSLFSLIIVLRLVNRMETRTIPLAKRQKIANAQMQNIIDMYQASMASELEVEVKTRFLAPCGQDITHLIGRAILEFIDQLELSYDVHSPER
jgi:hypothetical protein